ncbi:proline iminopeptidase-family hydrolase [Streptomyces sp. NPDC057136]|uniref:proline iminopeptidase-family hydrolase n=1 Tax=Streptomyces sp. NPDC057136 TaxID=3346029 RepID=UPI0036342252
MFAAPSAKGTVPFGDYRTWYRVTGELDSGNPPLIVAHGGPGSTHDYLLALTALAEQGWPIVHYDQLGNGGSTHLPERGADFWTVDLFLDELDNLLQQLDIADDYVFFGQSWGGMLGAEHAVRQPAGLRGLIIADSPASMPIWRAEALRLRGELPPETQSALNHHEAAGTFDSPEYQQAMFAYYQRFVCRVDPVPPELATTFIALAGDPTVYRTMNGPNDFHVIGTLSDWSVVDRLPAVEAPTLLISGRYDEATPATVQPFHDGIPDVRWEIFEESSHMPHLEEPELFLDVMGDFLGSLG